MSAAGAIIKAQLEATSAVTDLVGTGTSARIYPLQLPQDPTLPAITYQEISATRVHGFGDDPNLLRSRIMVSPWADTYAGLKALEAAIRAALSRQRGTIATYVVDDILLDNELDQFEDQTQGRRAIMDFLVWFTEA